MKPIRVALIGMGRMGRSLDALAPDRDVNVVARLTAADMRSGLAAGVLAGAQVAIEFTVPESATRNAIACLEARCPVVIGTTGWSARQSEVENAVKVTGCPALHSPNFSIGVQLFLGIAEDAAARMRVATGFDVRIVETHHAAKLDAPSGTAIAIGERLSSGLGHDVGISSVRVGSVPGIHEVVFDASFEQIRLVHETRDRRVFAEGALVAARWLAAGRAPVLYTMRDVLRANAGAEGE